MFMPQKKGFAAMFFICSISCGLVLFAESTNAIWLVPIAVLLAKSSITVAFCLLYFTNIDFFENQYLGFVMGVNNVFGRTSTILSPIIAEIGEPLPMLSCIFICVLSLFLSLRLEQPECLKKDKDKNSDQEAKESSKIRI